MRQLESLYNATFFLLVNIISGIGSKILVCPKNLWMQLLNHIYSDLIGPFLQSAFSLCYLGCESNILFLENSLEGEVSSCTSLHHCGCIISCLDIFLHYLASGRFTRVPSVILVIFSSTWCYIKDDSCFYLVMQCISSIGSKGWCM